MVLDTISEFCRNIKSEPLGGRDDLDENGADLDESKNNGNGIAL